MIAIYAENHDGDPSVRAALLRAGVASKVVATDEDLLDLLDGADGPRIRAVAFDLGEAPEDGLKRLKALLANRPELKVIASAERASLTIGVDAMKAGAVDFLPAPIAPKRIIAALQSIAEQRGPSRAPERAAAAAATRRRPDPDPAREDSLFNRLIAESPVMNDIIREVKRGAASMIPILLTGESGVGKEVFARAIHDYSDRRDKPFVAVNCGAIPEQLVESILFGHEKGAFTGAIEKRVGKFVEADGGVLFLDEIGELPLEAQVKLLRALQEGEVDPVGGDRSVSTDIRLVTATNRELPAEIEGGRFRSDLFYRISVFPIRLPPLRRRAEDIVPLAELLARRWAEVEGKPFEAFSDTAARMLRAAPWPGNVRQLENVVYRALLLSDGPRIEAEALLNLADEMTPASPDAEAAERHPFFDETGEFRTLAEIEAAVMAAALERYDGSMSEAARRLGVGRSTLYRRLKGEAA